MELDTEAKNAMLAGRDTSQPILLFLSNELLVILVSDR